MSYVPPKRTPIADAIIGEFVVEPAGSLETAADGHSELAQALEAWG